MQETKIGKCVTYAYAHNISSNSDLAVKNCSVIHADQCSSFFGSSNHASEKYLYVSFVLFTIIEIIEIIEIILQVNALLATLKLTESAGNRGHFALYNCLVLGHTKNNGVHRVYCNPFPAKPFLWQSPIGPCYDSAAG